MDSGPGVAETTITADRPTHQMKTDHPIYLFLSTGAEAFRVLTGGQRLIGDYPYVAVFAPLMIDRDDDLRARAPALWHTV